MSETEYPQRDVRIVPTETGERIDALSPVPDADPLKEWKDDGVYRSKHITPRAALRRSLARLSKVKPDSKGLAPGVAEALAEWDEVYGSSTPRRVVDDIALRFEAMLRRDNIKPGEMRDFVTFIFEQLDGPPKQTLQHDVSMMEIVRVNLPAEQAERL